MQALDSLDLQKAIENLNLHPICAGGPDSARHHRCQYLLQ